MLFLVIEPELDGIVAVSLLGFALQNAVGTGQDNRDRRDEALGIIDASLAEFFSEESYWHGKRTE